MFCRNCGKEIEGNPKVCASCSSPPTKGTSFCRYCGSATSEQDVTCPKCEAVIKVAGEAEKGWSRKTKQRLIIAAAIFVIVYGVLATTARIIIKPLQSAVSGIILNTTGYTAFPLNSISSNPNVVPIPAYNDRADDMARFVVDQTQQLIISAKYTKNLSTSSGISKDVTDTCVFQSNDEQIARVTATGLVQAIAPGTTSIKVSYTAIPGSSDFANASKGKIPITLTISVPVTVNRIDSPIIRPNFE